MQTIRHGTASRFIQRGSGCSSQRALQCARPTSSKRPARKPGTCVYSIILPNTAQTSINKVTSQYQRFSRSWVAPLVLAVLTTASVAAIAASVILAVIKSKSIWAAARATVVDQNKDLILTCIIVGIAAVAGFIGPCVYYFIDTAYKWYKRSSLCQDKTLEDWAKAEGLEHLFKQEVIEHLNSLGYNSAKELAAAAASDSNFLFRVWTKRKSGESKDMDFVKSQADAMTQYLKAYHERVIQAMAAETA